MNRNHHISWFCSFLAGLHLRFGCALAGVEVLEEEQKQLSMAMKESKESIRRWSVDSTRVCRAGSA